MDNFGKMATDQADVKSWRVEDLICTFLAYDNMAFVGCAPRNPCSTAMPVQDRPNWRGSM